MRLSTERHLKEICLIHFRRSKEYWPSSAAASVSQFFFSRINIAPVYGNPSWIDLLDDSFEESIEIGGDDGCGSMHVITFPRQKFLLFILMLGFSYARRTSLSSR